MLYWILNNSTIIVTLGVLILVAYSFWTTKTEKLNIKNDEELIELYVEMERITRKTKKV